MTKKIRIMTFNIRFENDQDGSNAWFYRRELVVKVIRRYLPDIFGVQEGRWNQLLYLQDHLPYHLNAIGRTVDSTCQYPTLFIRKDCLEVMEGGEFWLSKTPEVHRSKDWDSAFPRMLNYAKVRFSNTPDFFWTAVTHLDHKGVKARYEQAKIIVSWIKKRIGEPLILMGDFNDGPTSPVHELLTGPETGLFDTWQLMSMKEDADSFTHHGFTGVPHDSRIDWILVTPHFKVLQAKILRDNFSGRYPSDHFPYMVDLLFSSHS